MTECELQLDAQWPCGSRLASASGSRWGWVAAWESECQSDAVNEFWWRLAWAWEFSSPSVAASESGSASVVESASGSQLGAGWRFALVSD